MDFDGNFRRVAQHPTDGLRDRVAALSAEDWLEDAWRQHVYRPHRESNTILLMFDKDYRHDAPTRLPAHARFEEELTPLYAALERYYGRGYPVRALFARLPAGARVHPHADAGFSLTNAHRVHLAVVTNPGATFTIGGEDKVLPYGELWEVNNQRVHSVHNSGPSDRVHLLVDWVIPDELRFFRRHSEPEVFFRFAPGFKLETPLGRPNIITVKADAIEPVELPLTREIEPIARWLRMRREPFTVADMRAAITNVSDTAMNDALDALVRTETIEHAFRPFPP